LSELQHPNNLVGTVFPSADRNYAIPPLSILGSIFFKNTKEFLPAGFPIDLISFFVGTTSVADAILAYVEIRLGIRHYAFITVIHLFLSLGIEYHLVVFSNKNQVISS
jgi:hypothetical protein